MSIALLNRSINSFLERPIVAVWRSEVVHDISRQSLRSSSSEYTVLCALYSKRTIVE